MSYLEAAWDGSVERVSDALRAGVHADTTMLVSDLGTLDTLLLYMCKSQQGQYFSNFNTTSFIMCVDCKNPGVVLDTSSCMLRGFKCKCIDGEQSMCLLSLSTSDK